MATIWEETKAQGAKMKGKPFKEKLAYFWEYYKIHTCVVLGGIILIYSLVHTIATAKDYALSVVMINSMADTITGENGDSLTDNWIDGLSGLIEYDPNKYEIAIDASFTMGTNSNTGNSEYTNAQKLAAMMSAKTVDVIVSNTAMFEQYAQNQYYYDLREIYTVEELSALSDYIYYTDGATFSDYEAEDWDTASKQMEYKVDHHNPDSMKDPIPVGFFTKEGTRIGDKQLYSYFTEDDKYQGYVQEGVMGIIVNTPRVDASKIAIMYFLGR